LYEIVWYLIKKEALVKDCQDETLDVKQFFVICTITPKEQYARVMKEYMPKVLATIA
jgi:hypothetical protein